MILQPRKPGRRGAVLVDLALMIPVFLMFIFMIVEFAFFVSVRHTLENAARVGVRYASVNLDQGVALTASTRTQVMNQIGYYGTSGIIIGIDPAALPTITYQAPFSASNHIKVVGYSNLTGLALATPESAGMLDQVAVEIYAAYKPIVPVTRLLGIFGVFQGNVSCMVNVRATAEYN